MGLMSLSTCFLCLAVFFVGATDSKPSVGGKKVVCYYTNWSYKRPSPYDFTPNNIDPYICTHIIYAFADIGFKNNLIASDNEFDFNRRAYVNITALKKKNPSLKIMVGIGGWQKGTLGFARIVSNETNRREFSKNSVRFIRGYQFDGLDLNWQHPTVREGGLPEDKENYVLLAQTLREEFEKEAASKNKPRLLLSIAISHQKKFLPGYDIGGFNTYMDFISVICYDYHFSYEAAVNHHSPLYALEDDNDYNYDGEVNINYTISFFSELADPEKLVLGIPTYGRSYKLVDPAETALGSDADGPGSGGPVTNEKGWFAHFEICNFVKNEGWTVVQTKPEKAGPYAYKGDQWVCYDDIPMIQTKAKYANEKGLGGIMFWTLDYDDFLGKCQEETFPLIRAARDALMGSTSDGDMVFEEDKEDDSSVPSAPPPTRRTAVSSRTPAVVQPPRQQRPATPLTSLDEDLIRTPQEQDRTPLEPSAPRPVSPRFPMNSKPTSTPGRVRTPAVPQSDVSVVQTNLVDQLVHLIEKAGGVDNFCKIVRNERAKKTNILQKRGYNTQGDNENSLLLESPKLPPILLIMQNSSIYIKEINVFNKP